MKEMTVVIKYTCQESLEAIPDQYIRSLRESIALVAHDNDRLEEIRVELINCRATVDQYQNRIWAEKNGYGKEIDRGLV